MYVLVTPEFSLIFGVITRTIVLFSPWKVLFIGIFKKKITEGQKYCLFKGVISLNFVNLL